MRETQYQDALQRAMHDTELAVKKASLDQGRQMGRATLVIAIFAVITGLTGLGSVLVQSYVAWNTFHPVQRAQRSSAVSSEPDAGANK